MAKTVGSQSTAACNSIERHSDRDLSQPFTSYKLLRELQVISSPTGEMTLLDTLETGSKRVVTVQGCLDNEKFTKGKVHAGARCRHRQRTEGNASESKNNSEVQPPPRAARHVRALAKKMHLEDAAKKVQRCWRLRRLRVNLAKKRCIYSAARQLHQDSASRSSVQAPTQRPSVVKETFQDVATAVRSVSLAEQAIANLQAASKRREQTVKSFQVYRRKLMSVCAVGNSISQMQEVEESWAGLLESVTTPPACGTPSVVY